jgi:hypothetical protein
MIISIRNMLRNKSNVTGVTCCQYERKHQELSNCPEDWHALLGWRDDKNADRKYLHGHLRQPVYNFE